ncbi:MAG: tRNA (adenosine(37)-N6)-threonylcarbamoyltransferase complex transferase subunit TsaD [Candidatus Neomarinimicrobiota bacterium]|nr:MAG: tRNA (adenosine(37)-N6)-threonylcarbamoyltransferase complex transferase subunit TsaD [Candidatus Neomarinimicrobiota bacterium]
MAGFCQSPDRLPDDRGWRRIYRFPEAGRYSRLHFLPAGVGSQAPVLSAGDHGPGGSPQLAGSVAQECRTGGNPFCSVIVLGIESSCDETGVAVCQDGRIRSALVSSQEIHRRYGGVVPEIASREHEKWVNPLVDQALKEAGIEAEALDGIAVTRGPGLAGTLLTGVCFAKGLALSLGRPIVGVNHIEAHIFANFLAQPSLTFPFVCLLVSGGHTQLWYVHALQNYRLLGTSRDDAAGEALDKGARILGLGYPGGPEIERQAEGGRPQAVSFPRAFSQADHLDFSFSGLKTSLLYFMDSFRPSANCTLRDVAASYQEAVMEILAVKLSRALEQTGAARAVIAGGVAANRRLRQLCQEYCAPREVIFPDARYCTDNGAMIAYLGEIYLSRGLGSDLDFPVQPNLRLPTQ